MSFAPPAVPNLPEVTLTKNRIEPGKTERPRGWMAEIRSRRDEAVETLRLEGMWPGAAFLERTADADYLVYNVEAEDIHHVFEAFESSPYGIDREHRAVVDEVLADDQPERDIEPLHDLANPDRE